MAVITRRTFVGSTSRALVALATGPSIFFQQRGTYDLVIRGGTVFDGTGAAGVESDVAISAGKIAAIKRRISEKGTDEIDARGFAVAPGFIDIHSHGDGSMQEDPRVESLIRQGITTIVVGQDGSSRGPGSEATAAFESVFASIERLQPAVNVASMIGAGTIRGMVVGNMDRPATEAEIGRMVGMVASALAQGACGVSSGLEYTPGGFAPLAELVAICRPLAMRRLPYATHMRNEDDRLLESISESIAVARGANCPLQISHLKTQGPRNWPKLDTVLSRVDTATLEGIDIAFDRYPYLAYATGLTNLFPIWSRDGGTDAFLRRLDEPESSTKIKTETLAKVDLIGGWDNVMITSARNETDRAAEGQRMSAYARSASMDPYDMTVAMLKRNRGSIGMVGFAMSETNLERILAHPRGMVCSDGGAFAIDGPARGGSPHPRGLGTFPRVLGRYVRERKALTLPAAIKKMTSLPASRIRLSDRGRLATGLAADVVVFDPERVEDKATYENPFQYPVGINVVIVNGMISLRDGERQGRGNGRAVRPG